MTRNQIEYQKVVESKRAAQAQEELTRQRDAETARANLANETERHRSATAQEQLTMLRDSETQRSNMAREFENNRANLAKEQENARVTNETIRSNLAREFENNRHNKATESISRIEVSETQRSNLAKELETNRANLAKEAETNRANLEQEKQRTLQTLLSPEQTERSARATEYAAQTRADSTISAAEINSATQQAINQAREEGLSDRQIRQILADSGSQVYDTVEQLLLKGNGLTEIRRIVSDLLWRLRR